MKRKSDIENARLALGLADRTAQDKVSGSFLALIKGVWGMLLLVYLIWDAVRMGISNVLIIPVGFKAVGTLVNFVNARRGALSVEGYTIAGLGRVIFAVFYTMVFVSFLVLFGMDIGLLLFLVVASYNVLLFRAGTILKDSLHKSALDKKVPPYSPILTISVFVIAVAVSAMVLYDYLVEDPFDTVIHGLLYSLSVIESVGIDPFTPFLLERYRRRMR